jgi:Zn-dependent peptidase ImmA (M78 family)
VRISTALAEAVNRENRLRTTLTHEYAHVHFHRFLFEESSRQSRLFPDPAPVPINRCHRHTIEHASKTDWLEWQAGHCCGALLMPLSALEEEVRLFSSKKGCGCREVGAHSRDGILLVEHVSQAFRVSKQATRVRLLKRGILQEDNHGTVDFHS